MAKKLTPHARSTGARMRCETQGLHLVGKREAPKKSAPLAAVFEFPALLVMKKVAGCFFLFWLTSPAIVLGQGAVELPQQEQRNKERQAEAKQQTKVAQETGILEIRGNRAFTEKELRNQLKEQITFIEQNGLTSARADDAAFFLELFYRKHGFAKVNVSYTIVGGGRLRLDISEGPQVFLGTVFFVGNQQIGVDRLFDFAVGPTRERVSKAQKLLPFVP